MTEIINLECPRCGKSDLTEKRTILDKALLGAAAGGAAGSFLPGVGNLAGAFIGGAYTALGFANAQKKYKCGHCEYTWGSHQDP